MLDMQRCKGCVTGDTGVGVHLALRHALVQLDFRSAEACSIRSFAKGGHLLVQLQAALVQLKL